MGYALELHSVPGEGSTFSIVLAPAHGVPSLPGIGTGATGVLARGA